MKKSTNELRLMTAEELCNYFSHFHTSPMEAQAQAMRFWKRNHYKNGSLKPEREHEVNRLKKVLQSVEASNNILKATNNELRFQITNTKHEAEDLRFRLRNASDMTNRYSVRALKAGRILSAVITIEVIAVTLYLTFKLI